MKRAAIIASLALAWLCVATPARAQGEQKKRRQLTTAAATCGLADSTGYIALQVGNANGGATLTLAGTWSGTISFFASGDGGATWNAVNVTPSNSTTAVTTATANGTWQLNPAAYTHICAAFTTATSGNVLATIQLSTASARSSGGGGGGGSGTISPGTTSTLPKYTNGAGAIVGNSALTDSGTQLGYTGAAGALFAAPGVFTGAASNETHQFTINGPCPAQAIIGGAHLTDTLTGCAVIPSSGVTNTFTAAVSGYVKDTNPNQTGLAGLVEGVGGFFSAYCSASNTQCEGSASQTFSDPSLSGVVLLGTEVSVVPENATDSGYGLLLDVFGTNAQPTGDSMPAVAIQSPTGTGTFTSGFECQPASTALSRCVVIGKINNAGLETSSQQLHFTANNGSADFSANFLLQGAGFFEIDNPLIGLPGAFGTFIGSTNALSYNELVKIDTANPDAVVACTTSDTTACMGFVADKQGSGAGGLCTAASAYCGVVTIPGSRVQGILGTGTCAIGNYVIVDTTTNGDIKCTATPPAARAEMGLAMSAQSTVGQTVDVLTKFQ